MSQAVPKFDLVLQTFNSTLEEFYVKRLCLILRYKQQQHVTPQQLREKFRFFPTATSRTANPETRLAIAQQADAVQASYLQAKTLVMAGQMQMPDLILVYHAKRQTLADLGIRQPETYLGPEPQIPAPAPIPGMGAPGQPQPGQPQPAGGPAAAPQMTIGGPANPLTNLALPNLLAQRLQAGIPPGGIPSPGAQ
jgi:hypothetical protein